MNHIPICHVPGILVKCVTIPYHSHFFALIYDTCLRYYLFLTTASYCNQT